MAVTIAVAEPRVTWVFWKTMFVRSPMATSPDSMVPRSLGTGALSPVSAASCTSSVAEVTIRPSAGTSSPASSSTTSPGTSSADSISSTLPVRRTRALGTCRLASASTLARAFISWLVPATTLNVTSSVTTTPVATWWMPKLATATISSMMFIGLESWTFATDHMLGGGSVGSTFCPVLRLALLDPAGVEPLVGVDLQPLRHLVGGQGVPGDVFGLGLDHAHPAPLKPAVGARRGTPVPRADGACRTGGHESIATMG